MEEPGTHLKFNSSSYRNPKRKDRLPLPSLFRGKLLNFGGVEGFKDVFFFFSVDLQLGT